MTWHQSEVKAASSRVVVGANLYGKADDGAGVCIARAAAVDALVQEEWNVYVLAETLLHPFHPGSQHVGGCCSHSGRLTPSLDVLALSLIRAF